jgi:SAM-dependent methyltransferase
VREPEAIGSALKRRAIDVLGAVGLARPLYEARRRIRLGRIRDGEPGEVDGLPVPPPRLRFYAGDNADLGDFIEGGRKTAAMIAARVRAAGVGLESLEAILDFGCGCGRVARHWAGLEGPRLCGCDYNPELVEWCRRNLPFLEARRNELEPPLPYREASFDLVYGISVLTHLPVELQRAWVAELRRLLRPGGLLLLTLHGDRHAAAYLRGGELRAYEAGEPVVIHGPLAGTNGCAAFHPPSWVRGELLGDLDQLAFAPSEQVPEVGQDLYLARVS